MKRISKFDDEIKKEIEKILYKKVTAVRCKCLTERITIMMSVLAGFDKNIRFNF